MFSFIRLRLVAVPLEFHYPTPRRHTPSNHSRARLGWGQDGSDGKRIFSRPFTPFETAQERLSVSRCCRTKWSFKPVASQKAFGTQKVTPTPTPTLLLPLPRPCAIESRAASSRSSACDRKSLLVLHCWRFLFVVSGRWRVRVSERSGLVGRRCPFRGSIRPVPVR